MDRADLAMPDANSQLKTKTNVDQILIDLGASNISGETNSPAWLALMRLWHGDLENDDLEKLVRFLTLANSSHRNMRGKIYCYLDELDKRNYADFDDLLQWVLINIGGDFFLNAGLSLSESFVRRIVALGFEANKGHRAFNPEICGWHSKVWEVNADQDNDRQHEHIPKLFYRRLVASSSGLSEDELLLEALLLRGFLAYRDEAGVWLGTGSHPDDLIVLKWVHGLSIRPEMRDAARLASIRFNTSNRGKQLSSVAGILSIPQNTSLMGELAYPYQLRVSTWAQYSATVWGTKLSVSPSTFLRGRTLGYDALDAGIALLVKAWPLARVSTAFGSCDGHGQSAPSIGLGTKWDRLWAKAVFESLAVPTPYSVWFEQDHSNRIRSINNLYDDASLLGLMDDIQRFARRLLDMTVIEKIGCARSMTLAKFGLDEPNIEDFAFEAVNQLSKQSF